MHRNIHDQVQRKDENISQRCNLEGKGFIGNAIATLWNGNDLHKSEE